MKITRILSRRDTVPGRAEVFLRLTVDHTRQYRLKSGIHVHRRLWENTSTRPSADDRNNHAAALRRLAELEERIFAICVATPRDILSADYIRARIGLGQISAHGGVHRFMNEFLASRELSESRRRQYRSLARMILRYERHLGHTVGAEELAAAGCMDFTAFLRNEHTIDPGVRPRGHNTICSVLSRVRCFLKWLARNGRCPACMEIKPAVGSEIYGTPYFLSAEELESVAHADFSTLPSLAKQRDVFVFQCLTGCRVSDLMRMRQANIVDGALEYVASKTRRDRADIVRVPLHPLATEIISRHAGNRRLLPFVNPAAYNRSIRAVLRHCGIVRRVSILDPLSLTEQQHRICDIAGSHMARRTFVGNLYRTAKDPGLVSSMSGHKPGSAAFARYRHIDDSLKSELISQTFCRQNAHNTH